MLSNSDSSLSSVNVSSGKSVSVGSSDEKTAHTYQTVQKYINEHIVTKYKEKYFPREMLKMEKEGATMAIMDACGCLWKWPEKEYVIFYRWHLVIFHIESTKTSRTRNLFSDRKLEFKY